MSFLLLVLAMLTVIIIVVSDRISVILGDELCSFVSR